MVVIDKKDGFFHCYNVDAQKESRGG
jgi:hypothetical protein